jgi:hypothetical protein
VDEILALSTDPAWKTNDRVWASNDDFRTIALIVKQLAEDIEDSWRMPRQNGMMDICLEMVPSLVDMERPTEPAVQVTIEVGSVGYEDLTISLCYVVSMVDLILSNVTEE